MPEWNIIVQEEKVTRLYEKVLGYLVSQNHPKVKALGNMLDDTVASLPLSDSSSSSARDILLKRIKYWRDVFELRKVLKGHSKQVLLEGSDRAADASSGDAHRASSPARSYFYLKPRHPTTSTTLVPSSSSSSKQSRSGNDNHDGTDDDDHNFSVNARLCKGILSATPGWSVAFNGVKCLYGMSWLCEFWTSTRFKSRSLHPKWENSGWRCGDVRTTVEEADRLLKIKASTVRDAMAKSPSASSSAALAAEVARLERGLVDPRLAVLSTINGVPAQTLSSQSQHGAKEGEDDQHAVQMRMDAASPFLFSSARDYPRHLEQFLFYDPRRVVQTYHTTDMKSIRPPSPDELEAIFGKERMETRE